MDIDTPAQQRLRDELLAWDAERPAVDPGLASRLRAALEQGVAEVLDEHDVGDERLWVSKSALDRLACDGWWVDRRETGFTPSSAMVAGVLAHRAIELDQGSGRRHGPDVLVRRAWDELATDAGAMADHANGLDALDADMLRDDVLQLLTDHRDTWPLLPVAAHVRTEQQVRVRLAAGRVVLLGAPDMTIGSVRDDRARMLLVDLKTGMRREQQERQDLRFYALLLTLKYGQPPFRWASYYVAEGGWDAEDLDEQLLWTAVRRTVDGVRQAARLLTGGDLHLRPGGYCRFCSRRDDCPAYLSQGPATVEA
jgi:hypothetical protein